MRALLVDDFAHTEVLDLAAGDTDEALFEILEKYKETLIRMGLSYDWLSENGPGDNPYFTPQWTHNVRVFEWGACYSHYESDDRFVNVFVVDSRRAKTAHTVIFVAQDGEEKIYASDLVDIPDVLVDLQWQLADRGFEWSLEDTEAVFSRRWVLSGLLAPEKTDQIRDGVWQLTWAPGFPENVFGRLRCFIFRNNQGDHPSFDE
jgi:hypothetical protein